MEASSPPVHPAGDLESQRSIVDRVGDFALKWISALAAAGSVALIGLIIYKVVEGARPSISEFGISFVWHQDWNAVTSQFGALDFIFGTVYTTAWAVLFAAPISIAIALFSVT